jgi:hypothetical protein
MYKKCLWEHRKTHEFVNATHGFTKDNPGALCNFLSGEIKA